MQHYEESYFSYEGRNDTDLQRERSINSGYCTSGWSLPVSYTHLKLGVGEELPNKVKPDVYAFGLVTIGEDSVIPDGVQIGKNTAIDVYKRQVLQGLINR